MIFTQNLFKNLSFQKNMTSLCVA